MGVPRALASVVLRSFASFATPETGPSMAVCLCPTYFTNRASLKKLGSGSCVPTTAYSRVDQELLFPCTFGDVGVSMDFEDSDCLVWSTTAADAMSTAAACKQAMGDIATRPTGMLCSLKIKSAVDIAAQLCNRGGRKSPDHGCGIKVLPAGYHVWKNTHSSCEQLCTPLTQ